MNNAVFDKTMENIRNHVDIKLLTKWNGWYGAEVMIAKSNFHSLWRKFDCYRTAQIGSEVQQADLCVYLTYRKSACTNFTMSICYYCFATNVKLCTPTQTVLYRVEYEDVYETMKRDFVIFDTTIRTTRTMCLSQTKKYPIR